MATANEPTDFRNKINSRKLAVTAVVFAAATSLLVTNQIDATVWRDIVLGTVCMYLGSQAYVDKNSRANS